MGEKVTENRIGDWLGLYKIITMDLKSKIVIGGRNDDSLNERYNIVQIELFREATECAASFMEYLIKVLSTFSICKDVSRVHSIAQQHDHAQPCSAISWRRELTDENPYETHPTGIVSEDDPRTSTKEMRIAGNSEIQDLLSQGTFRVVPKRELSKNANL